jgi:hypothetical protein
MKTAHFSPSCIRFFTMTWWLVLAPLTHASPASPPLLTVRLVGSSVAYYVHEYRYWRGKTVVCAIRGVTENGDGPLICHTVLWDRHRYAVLLMLPALAQLSRANNQIGCGGLDTGSVELEGSEQGQLFVLKGEDPEGCDDAASRLVAKLLMLIPTIRRQTT